MEKKKRFRKFFTRKKILQEKKDRPKFVKNVNN